jgi:hypothetical protein
MGANRIAALGAAALVGARNGWNRNQILTEANFFKAWLDLTGPVADFTITADQPTNRGDFPVSLTFPDTQQDTLRITAPVDAEGVAVTDTFAWTVDNGAVLVLTPAADTMSCLIVPGTAQGAATVTATASDGVARTFAVDVTTGPVANFSIAADTPVDRPAPAAAPTA